MALRIRRGTEAQRTGKTFELGELVYTTDAQQLWVGDGITAGGTAVVGSNVAGPGLFFNTSTRKLQVQGLTTDEITQGVNNKYFSTELAVDAVGAALVAGNLTNVGITFTYSQTQDDAGRINATVALDGVGITDVVNDTSPSLGGDLDLNTNDIFGTGAINITGNITASDTVTGETVSGDTLTTGTLSLSGSTIGISTGTIKINNVAQNILQFNGINANGSNATTPQVNLFSSRGTLLSPTNSQAGDYLGVLNFGGYYGSNNLTATSIISLFESTATMTDDHPASALAFVTNSGPGYNIAYFSGKGVFNAPVFKATGYATGSLPTSPEEGFMVFDSTTKQFKGWNGTAWVVLG
jgi:hypothetical protein